MSAACITCFIATLVTAGIMVRPFGLPEAIWAVTGAILVVVLQLLSPAEALVGVSKGGDVYLFLPGMMLLSEIAREQGFFDWLAAMAVRQARGSAKRLFLLIYGVGALVTTFLSNDATAVVLTPRRRGGDRHRESGTASPLPADLCVHRQCGFVCSADLKPRESRDLR